jgi:enoyl-CoA hydratase/3-hydroxyacyl-CoA dehydrogenase
MNVDDIDTVAVIGAGAMGHGIAEVAALAGFEVTLRDINEEVVQEGYERIEWSLGKLVERDRLSDEEADAALERVTPLVAMERAVGEADVVIEAVPERMEIKRDVYEEIDAHAPEESIIATNTSSLSITDLGEALGRPASFCGMHFFNPPIRMDLVEVITGAETEAAVLETVEDLAEAFGKTPIRVRKDSPGFVVNRVLVPLMNEACWMVSAEEATVAEIDSTAKYDIGLPMGAFELGDEVGNDVTYDVLEYMSETLGDAYEPAPFLEEAVEAGRYGKKAGEGFYDYENGGADIPAEAGSDTVRQRLLAAMANEIGHLVGGDVAPAEEIDRAVMLGAGFPDGPARMADQAGLEGLIETLEARHEETGAARYAVSDGLREAAAAGGFREAGSDEAEASYDTIRVEHPAEKVARIVLDRPQRLNTINDQLLDELESALDRLEDDEEVRSLIVTGAGDRFFSAGADVQSMATSATPLSGVELSRRGQQVFGRLEESPMPVVAAIDGYCLGGGMELSMCADLRVASEGSEFGQPELDLGLIPGWGGTQRLQHIVGEGRAREIILTADRYEPETMADYGFLNEVVPKGELQNAALELAEQLAGGPPVAQELAKRAMLRGWENTDAGLEIEAQGFGTLMSTDDLMEGVTAFMSDRDPEFEGK